MERAPEQNYGISKRSINPQLFHLLLLVLVNLAALSNADIGTAAQYDAPFSPTVCHGSDEAQFPSSELFGSAGEEIWDNGEACGRLYSVQCISASDPTTCIPDRIIHVKIVDRALTSASRPSREDVTIVLSTGAFGMIADASATFINIQFIP
ncbi:EG45-like domain containing protein 2 [Corylus avellana]|uniref:EG45-like domain containing protein 2 n=1 Tax=Corylus avellana TaxID=13451 RepID=UPI001E21F5DA|nr:EG45-like domain containing protein 2 [Corylus avellana]